MVRVLWGLLGAMVIALLAVGGAPARAGEVAASSCHAAIGEAGRTGHWRCDRTWGLVPHRAVVRLAAAPGGAPPEVLATRLTRFAAMTLTVRSVRGEVAVRQLRPGDFTPGEGGWIMRTPLPRLDAPLAAVELDVTGARHVGLFAEARLEDGAPPTLGATRFELLVAGLCGLLCAPLLFNFAFWRVLRQRFLVWHTFAVVAMLVQTLVASGLINRFASFSVTALSLASPSAFAVGIAAAALFAADLIEPDKLDPLHRRLLAWSVPWVIACTALYLFAPGPLLPIATRVYFAGFVPVLALFGWVMAVALRRGSRAVKYQIAAWLPFMAVGGARVASAFGVTPAPLGLDFEQQLAIVAEILITGLAAVDRFMTLRRQRDHALIETSLLEDAVERDPLTGLLNRRALEARFAHYYTKGFRTVAVIDLDHFKQVNDRFGHAVGDKVLCVVATALASDEDTRAIRLGGEEFMLLLRGRDAAARAEQRRNAIPLRIAAEVAGLDRVVTASMGLVEQAASAVHADFPTLYAHCDRLLYEAKRTGRNRTMAERLQSFTERRSNDRRSAEAAAA